MIVLKAKPRQVKTWCQPRGDDRIWVRLRSGAEVGPLPPSQAKIHLRGSKMQEKKITGEEFFDSTESYEKNISNNEKVLDTLH